MTTGTISTNPPIEIMPTTSATAATSPVTNVSTG